MLNAFLQIKGFHGETTLEKTRLKTFKAFFIIKLLRVVHMLISARIPKREAQ